MAAETIPRPRTPEAPQDAGLSAAEITSRLEPYSFGDMTTLSADDLTRLCMRVATSNAVRKAWNRAASRPASEATVEENHNA